MSTATQQQAKPAGNGAKTAASDAERAVEFVPFMAKESIKLTIGMVKTYIAKPTKNGHLPSDRDIVNFMMLCKARGLDPWQGDAFLIGYDSQNDGPTFSLITAHQALIKRAETHPDYDGMQSGVIVVTPDGEIVNRKGTFTLDTDKVVGGWAVVHFKNRTFPCEKTIKLSTYNTGRSRWKVDANGMVTKVAEAAALRGAFPNALGGMYLREEMDAEDPAEITPARPSSLDELTKRLTQQPTTVFTAAKAPQGETVPRHEQRRDEQPADIGHLEETTEAVDDPAPEDASQDRTEPPLSGIEALRVELEHCDNTTTLNSLSTRWIGPDSQLDEAVINTASDMLDAKRKSLEQPKVKSGKGKQGELV